MGASWPITRVPISFSERKETVRAAPWTLSPSLLVYGKRIRITYTSLSKVDLLAGVLRMLGRDVTGEVLERARAAWADAMRDPLLRFADHALVGDNAPALVIGIVAGVPHAGSLVLELRPQLVVLLLERVAENELVTEWAVNLFALPGRHAVEVGRDRQGDAAPAAGDDQLADVSHRAHCGLALLTV